MPLIKNNQAKRLIRNAVVLDFGDLGRQAEKILDEARREAGRVLDDARREAQRLIDEAAEVGRAQGLEQGLDEGRAQGRDEGRKDALEEFRPQLESIAAAWTTAIEQWESQRNDMLLVAREDVVALANALGTKVVHRAISLEPEAAADQLAAALSMLLDASAVTVRVHPEDRAMLDAVLPALVERIGTSQHVVLRDDPEVARGGCVVSSQGGRIDATIDRQLDRIAKAILPERHRDAEESPKEGDAG